MNRREGGEAQRHPGDLANPVKEGFFDRIDRIDMILYDAIRPNLRGSVSGMVPFAFRCVLGG